jgi:hypothetical protein
MYGTIIISAAQLKDSHKLVDTDGMIYSVCELITTDKMVECTVTHDNNDMLLCKINPQVKRFKKTTKLRILWIEGDEKPY